MAKVGTSSCGLCTSIVFFQAEDGIRDLTVTGVQTCALPILSIGNEVMEQWTNDDTTAIPIARELAGIVRRLDPTRPITSANNNGSPANPLFHAGDRKSVV